MQHKARRGFKEIDFPVLQPAVLLSDDFEVFTGYVVKQRGQYGRN